MTLRHFLGLAAILFLPCVAASGQESVRLEEKFPSGYQYHVSGRTSLSGSMTLPAEAAQDKKAKVIGFQGSSTVEYDERILDGDAPASGQKTLRLYDRLDYQRKVGEREEKSQLRKDARRLVILRRKHAEVPFSPDGPLTFGEIDRVRMDVFTPALKGLLPDRQVRPGDTWTASTDAVEELTDLDEIREGKLTLKFVDVQTRGGRQVAHVAISGTVRGTNDDGGNRQDFQGYYLFDLQGNYLAYLYFNGTLTLLDRNEQPAGKIDGTFMLTRQPAWKAELRDAVVKLIDTEPTPDNSALLFDEPTHGVRFIYPRRWTVRKADGRQILLDAAGGNSLLITLEPVKNVPSGQEFQTEALKALRNAKAQPRRVDAPRRIDNGREFIEHFQIDAETDQGKVILDYFVVKQVAGGATFAGRFTEQEAPHSHVEVDRMVRSLRLVPPVR